MQEENNKRVIREFTRTFKNEHNVDGVDHLFDTKNFVHHFRTPVADGFEGLKQIGRMMNGAFPDVVVKEEDMIASDDRVVERSSARATHKGSMVGEQPTNKPVAWSEIHIYRLRDGRIIEHWAEMSTMELLQQITVLPQLTNATQAADQKTSKGAIDMPIFQTGGYQVKPSAINKVKKAIQEFVEYVREHEPGTHMYLAWQEKNDPARFLHLFIFADEVAQKRHGESEAVKRFESIYSPELVGGDVIFTNYELISGKPNPEQWAQWQGVFQSAGAGKK